MINIVWNNADLDDLDGLWSFEKFAYRKDQKMVLASCNGVMDVWNKWKRFNTLYIWKENANNQAYFI